MNIKELAKELNLAQSTVSKALRDSYEISEATKERVRAAADRLNYVANPYASSLRKKNSKTIAVVLPEVADNFFSLAINGVQSIAESKGYHVLIYLSHDKYVNEKRILDDCASGRVDGVLISISCETSTADHFKKLKEENIPIVFFDRGLDNFTAANVLTNDYESGYLSAIHLVENGCNKPIFLSLSEDLSICKKRADGFIAGLTTLNMDVQDVIVYCPSTYEDSYKEIRKIIKSPHPPDGIVASVEKLAMQVYMACQAEEIKIPDSIKVVAFSTVEIAPILNPALTTITQPAFDIGKTAAEILFKGIEKKNYALEKENIVLPSKLVVRKSSRW